jgi:hypothetical protein
MEVGGCIQLVEHLLEEAARKITLVHKAMIEQEVQHATTKKPMTSNNASAPQEPHPLQTERGWLEKAYHGLTVAHNAFEKLEQFQRRNEGRPRSAARESPH